MSAREVVDQDGVPVHSGGGVYRCKMEFRITFKLWGLSNSWNYQGGDDEED